MYESQEFRDFRDGLVGLQRIAKTALGEYLALPEPADSSQQIVCPRLLGLVIWHLHLGDVLDKPEAMLQAAIDYATRQPISTLQLSLLTISRRHFKYERVTRHTKMVFRSLHVTSPPQMAATDVIALYRPTGGVLVQDERIACFYRFSPFATTGKARLLA
jgi:hypothetical protein